MIFENCEFRPCLNRRGEIYGGYWVSSDGRIASTKAGFPKILKKKPRSGNGYTTLWLGTPNGVRWEQKHVLVARSWLGLPTIEDPEVNHKDTVKTNDSIANLEWTNSQGNTQHAVDHRLFIAGEAHRMSEISDAQVRIIRTMYLHGWTVGRLTALFRVGVATVWAMVTGESRKYAGGPITLRKRQRTPRTRERGMDRWKLIAAASSEED